MVEGTRRLNKRIGTNSVCHVHHLNNRGCVSIINGNFAAGNELFESALQEHKLISEAGSSSLHRSASPPISSTSSCSRFCCDDSVDSDMDMDGYDSDSDDGNSIDSSTFRIQRITTSSQLRTVSFPGQCGEDENHRVYHQVYRLPIVMDEDEWEIASIKDITFVLIFNTALCNHLLGMQLLEEEMLHQANKSQLKPRKRQKLLQNHQLCGHYFSIARKLYKLAMETLFSSVRGVDRIYYVAIFNNMSHVCKTLEGYNSQEALWNDQQLLKSIYWWKDFEKKASSMLSPSPVMSRYSGGSTSTTSYTTVTPSTSANDDTILNRYSEEDAEIVDLFLENVFYLISAKEDCLPATVA